MTNNTLERDSKLVDKHVKAIKDVIERNNIQTAGALCMFAIVEIYDKTFPHGPKTGVNMEDVTALATKFFDDAKEAIIAKHQYWRDSLDQGNYL